MCERRIKAILSTTVLPKDGIYEIRTLSLNSLPDLKNVPHYISHPSTTLIVEKFGAIQAKDSFFKGLNIGEEAVAFSIRFGKSSRNLYGYTTHHQDVTLADLRIRKIKRIS